MGQPDGITNKILEAGVQTSYVHSSKKKDVGPYYRVPAEFYLAFDCVFTACSPRDRSGHLAHVTPTLRWSVPETFVLRLRGVKAA